MGANHEMPDPQCMDTIGQTHKFSLQLELYSNETNHKCDKWCLSFCSATYKSRSSTPGAVNVCNTAIGGTCSTWSLAEPSASSKESVVQEKAKYEMSLNQPQSRNPNHGCLIESLSISELLHSLSFFLIFHFLLGFNFSIQTVWQDFFANSILLSSFKYTFKLVS